MDTQKWITGLDNATELFKKEFGSLNAGQLNWKPNSETWSIGQNIDHLIVINKSYYPIIEKANKGSYKLPLTGKIKFIVSFFGNFIFNSVQPDRKKRIKTFPVWEPSSSNIDSDILSKFETEQSNLKQVIQSSVGLLDKGTVISSPLNRNIVYKLEKAYDIIVTHEQRHFEQAKEVLALLKKS